MNFDKFLAYMDKRQEKAKYQDQSCQEDHWSFLCVLFSSDKDTERDSDGFLNTSIRNDVFLIMMSY